MPDRPQKMTGTLITALNPSIDFEWKVDQVRWGEKNIVQSERRWAGGKGVNVARWLRHLGGRPRLLLPLGGVTGEELAGFLHQEQLTANILPLRDSTRVNVIVTTASIRQLRFNPPGPNLSDREWKAVQETVKKELVRSRLLVLSGGLPRGLPKNAYAELLALAHQAGVPAVLDCDGPALAAAVKAKPFLLKPNVHELAEWWGKPLPSLLKIKAAAREMSEMTGGWVLVSRGGAGGLLIHSENHCEFHASAPNVRTRNTVGAGDAMLAGVIMEIEKQSPPEEWLRHGIAVGTAATQCAAGELPGEALIRKMATQRSPDW